MNKQANNVQKTISRYGDQIIARMRVESAKDTSDAEIERTLGQTVLPDFCIKVAKEMRERGQLTADDIDLSKPMKA